MRIDGARARAVVAMIIHVMSVAARLTVAAGAPVLFFGLSGSTPLYSTGEFKASYDEEDPMGICIIGNRE
jgi:hypothetical protein